MCLPYAGSCARAHHCCAAGLFFGPAIGGYFRPVQVSSECSILQQDVHQSTQNASIPVRLSLCRESRRSHAEHNHCWIHTEQQHALQVGWIATGGLLGCVVYALLLLKESLDGSSRIEVWGNHPAALNVTHVPASFYPPHKT